MTFDRRISMSLEQEILRKQAESYLRDWADSILERMLRDGVPLTREEYLAHAGLTEPPELDAEFEAELIPPMFRRPEMTPW